MYDVRLVATTAERTSAHRVRSGSSPKALAMRPLLERIERGDIDPTMVITHRMRLDEAPRGYDIFLNKEDGCEKVVLSA